MTTLLTILTRARVIVLMAIFLCLPAEVFAATKFWKDTVSSGNWNTSTNWSAVSAAGTDNGGVPAAGEPVRIVHTNGAAHTVILDATTASLGPVFIDLTGAGTQPNTLSISSNFTLAAAGVFVGGHSGGGATNGRGAIIQSAGIVAATAGSDLFLAHGAGSTGTYTLSGTGVVIAPQTEYIGVDGSGTFNHSAGLNTLSVGGLGGLWVGFNAGSTGTYNLSGTGQLISNKIEVVGNKGTGFFNQTGGSNIINDAGNHLYLGFDANNNSPTGGTYTLSAGTLAVNSGDEYIGYNRVGTFNQTGGTNTVARDLYVGFNAGSTGTYKLSGTASLTTSSARVRGSLEITGGGTMLCNGDNFTSIDRTGGGVASFIVRGPGSSATFSGGAGYLFIASNGRVTMEITDGGSVTSDAGDIGNNGSGSGSVTVSGAGSVWNTGGLIIGQTGGAGTLTIRDQGLVNAGSLTMLGNDSTINLQGGTLRFNFYELDQNTINFQAGTVQLIGDRTVGADAAISDFFGITNYAIPAGKGLTIEGNTTLETSLTLDGGTFTTGQLVNPAMLLFQRGTLNITNQAITIGSGGPFGSTLDLAADKTLNVTLGITNQGLVTGDGQIGGPFTNAVSGELRASAGKSLKLTGSVNQNFGQVKLLGGEIEFTEFLANAPGALISGNGTIITRLGIFNEGTMNFAGTANIVGDVFNEPGARIISGGGGATVFYDDVRNNGEIRTSTNGFSVFFGAVTGSGTYTGTGTVNFEGDLKPGSSPASISFGGDVSFGVGASLEIEIGGLNAGSQHDQLSITGDLALDGELEVSLINGFNPSAGQSFNILDWGSLSGTFSTLSLPSLSTGLSWNTSQIYTTGVLSVAAVGLPGDYNNNGTVDAGDYVLWRKGGPLANEVDTPGTVNGADYTAWRARFGNTSGSGAGFGLAGTSPSQVPEPNVLLLAVFGCFVGVLPRQRIVCNQ